MSLLTEIKKDQLAARKIKDKMKATLLTTLIGEAEMVGKNDGNRESTDSEVTAVIKKFVKNIDETLTICHDDDLLIERTTLETYLPQQMTEEQLRQLVQSHVQSEGISGPQNMGVVMKFLSSNFAGQYDGKLASSVVREILK